MVFVFHRTRQAKPRGSLVLCGFCFVYTVTMRKPKTDLKRTQEELWSLCKQICRFRDGSNCYTCGAQGLQGSNQQTGHFIASSICGAYLRYDLRNLRVQCMRCNVRLSGNGAVFYDNLRRDFGQQYVNQLFVDKQKTVKAIDHYNALVTLYAAISGQLENKRVKDMFSDFEGLKNSFSKNPPK